MESHGYTLTEKEIEELKSQYNNEDDFRRAEKDIFKKNYCKKIALRSLHKICVSLPPTKFVVTTKIDNRVSVNSKTRFR